MNLEKYLLTHVCSGEPFKAYRLNRHALAGNNDNSLCPVRLLIINAMRHGNVKGGNTVEAILAHATTHPLKWIEWVNPQLPVFCHVTLAHTITRSQPMRTANMGMAFSMFQDIVDANVTLRSHDLRYGAADDLLRVVRGPQMAIQDIAHELDHSVASAANGVTRKYTKKSSINDTWQARVDLPDQRSTFTTIIFSNDSIIQPPSAKKRKFSAFDNVMHSNGADFINHLTQGADLSQPILLQVPSQSGQNTTRLHTRPRAGTYSSEGSFPCNEEDCCLQIGEAFHTLEYLQAHELKFHSKYLPAQCPIHGCQTGPLTTFEDLAAHIWDHLEPQSIAARAAAFVTCRIDQCQSNFPIGSMDLYQKHLRSVHGIQGAIATSQERGDNMHLCLFPGCDHAARFPNGGHSAGAGSPYALHLADAHGIRTTESRAIYQLKMYMTATSWMYYVLPILVQGRSEMAQEDEEPESVRPPGSKPVCTLPNCDKKGDKTCKNKRAKQEHVVTKHTECFPAACPVYGCTAAVSFKTFLHLDKHMKEVHLKYATDLYDRDMRIPCRIDKCTKTFKGPKPYKQHLQMVHRINNAVVFEEEKQKTHSCYVEGCDTASKFSNPDEYDAHLIQTHRLVHADQRRIFLKGTASRWIENYCSFVYNARFDPK
jgi:hypothetical protein